ncbi:MAG: EAL domain-containing protein [Alphaproteobacteria bacterium]|nr:EAL domain-containing protein [Alphaproteobacteria bacterium]
MGTNQIAIIGYVGFGFITMVIVGFMSGNVYTGFVTGLLIIIGTALGHEFYVRRDGFAKVARGVIGLRETVDRADGAVTRMKADFEKTVNDTRAAREALTKLQALQSATEEQIKAIQEQMGQGGGGEVIGQMQDGMHQLYAQQQQTSEDIAVIQSAGNQLHGEFQNMQQQLAAIQQQMQQMQTYMQDSIQQVHATVNSMMAAGGAPAPAAAAPPPPPPPPPPAPAAAPAPEEHAAAMAEPPAAVSAPAAPAPGGSDFTASVFKTLQDHLGSLGDSQVDASLRAVAEGLIADAVDLYVEPVVTLPERKPAFYECYGGVRGADGNALTIDQDLDMSGREQMMGAIENALMIRCMERIEKLDVSGMGVSKCFYNVPGVTLADRSFFGGMLGHLQNRPELAARLTMEFTQSALMEHGEQAVEDLVQLQECGCSFSIDEITDLAIDFESLVGFGFRFAKVGSKFIRVQANTSDDPESVRGLATTLREMGVDLIVENVETDLSLVELIAFEIGYGQGGLFGQPSVVQV